MVGLTYVERRCSRRWSNEARRAPVAPVGIEPFRNSSAATDAYGNGMLSTSPESDAYDRKLQEEEKKQLLWSWGLGKSSEAWRLELQVPGAF